MSTPSDLEQVRAACEEEMIDLRGMTFSVDPTHFTRNQRTAIRRAAIARLLLAILPILEECPGNNTQPFVAACAREIRGER